MAKDISFTDYPGIDYGLGAINIDPETGIRFGVISMNALACYAWESFEADYGEPTCPKCGNEVVDYDDEKHGDYDHFNYDHGTCCDYACETCTHILESETCFGDEPNGYTLNDGEYQASVDSYNDVIVLKSPYYTYAQFCSPCMPGAGHLENPCPAGPKTYCLDKSWFDGAKAPYPVFSVETDEEVLSAAAGVDDGKPL